MSSNSIYSFQSVMLFLQSINAAHVYYAKRKSHIKAYHNMLYMDICNTTSFLIKPSFTEQLFCYANNIAEYPTCAVCNNRTTYNSRQQQYHTYCSQTCSIKDMEKLIGVSNPSQLQSVKDKKKQKSLEKYGVENVSQSPEVKLQLSNVRKLYWTNQYENKDFTVNGLSKQQYRNRCHQYLETQYQKYKHILDPENKRGKYWHIDHVYSVFDGFLNNVPINVISDVSNLRLIKDTDNYKKHKSSHKTLSKLYEDYNQTFSFENS